VVKQLNYKRDSKCSLIETVVPLL